MRITENLRLYSLRRNVQLRGQSIAAIYDKLASQKEISRPSENPVQAGVIMRLRARTAALRQKISSANDAQFIINSATSTLQSVNDKLLEIRTMAVRAANSTMSTNDMGALADQVNQLLESLVQDANAKHGNRYIFSGTDTDIAAIAVTRDGNGDITTVTYAGNTAKLIAPIGSDRTFDLSVNGQETFIATSALQSVISLRDNLRNTSGLDSAALSAALSSDLGAVSAAEEDLRGLLGKVGARASELDMITQQTAASLTRTEELLSEKSDVDVAMLAIELSKEEVIYSALLSAGQKLFRTNLLDYI